jgi:phospholipase C
MRTQLLRRSAAGLGLALAISAGALAQSQPATTLQPSITVQPDSQAHNIKTVFVIVMENHNWTGNYGASIKGNPDAPYINYTLLPMASHAERYFNPYHNHPSLPNYIWLEAGSNLGVHSDGSPAQDERNTTEHLTTLLEHAGISWRAYEEDTNGTVCPLGDSGRRDSNGHVLYSPRHDPFVYFDDVTGHLNWHSAYCISHVRPFGELATDLSRDRVARYNFITPNLCDDMHDSCGGNAIKHGDEWLSKVVPEIMRSTAYRSGGALFITWDEAGRGDGPIPLLLLSPLAKGNYYQNYIYYDHGSLVRTIEEIFGVWPLLGDAAHQSDLRGLFRVFP